MREGLKGGERDLDGVTPTLFGGCGGRGSRHRDARRLGSPILDRTKSFAKLDRSIGKATKLLGFDVNSIFPYYAVLHRCCGTQNRSLCLPSCTFTISIGDVGATPACRAPDHVPFTYLSVARPVMAWSRGDPSATVLGCEWVASIELWSVMTIATVFT